MADDDDLEYSDTNVGSTQTLGVRKNIPLKLKGKGRGRGRKGSRGRRGVSAAKKSVIGSVPDDEDEIHMNERLPSEERISEKQLTDSISLDEVIIKLETPSFSPMDRTFIEPMHQNKELCWDHKVNLIGEKVINPMIHCCEKCSLPILNYGRMIPCKHVFCYECAKKSDKVDKICPKCDDKVQKVEQAPLGTVFMCTFGSSRLGPIACGRTYLSQRDLQAHINHRHLKPPVTIAGTTTTLTSTQASGNFSLPVPLVPTSATLGTAHVQVGRDPRDPRGHLHDVHVTQPAIATHGPSHVLPEHRDQGEHSRNTGIAPATVSSGGNVGQQRQYPHSPASYPSTIPVSIARPNLITVPIQDDNSGTTAQHSHNPPSHASQYPPQSNAPPPSHTLPPMQHNPNSYSMPPHTYQHPLPTPTYAQAPPITTQTFTPPVHHAPPPPPPSIHAPNPPMYSGPPPPPSVHHPLPVTYSTPPQRFPTSGNYDEGSYMQSWNSGSVRPPPPPACPPRQLAPAPVSNHNISHIPTRGPTDSSYRQQYYQ